MAQDAEQKSVQGIQDPSARKAAYYRLQREDAEKGAAKGDRGAAGTAANVYGKLGNAKKNQYYASEHYMGKGVADAGAAIDRAGEMFSKAIPFVAPEARGVSAAKSLIPKAIEGVGSSIASRVKAPLEEAANSARQFLGRAKPVAKKLEGGPRKVTGSAAKALTSTPKALKGQVSGRSKALTGGNAQGQKALPKPKTASFPDGKPMHPSAKAASSPTKRENPLAPRYNPQTGKSVGRPHAKSSLGIIPRWSDRVSRNLERDYPKGGAPKAPKQGPKNENGRVRGDRDSRKKSKAGG